MEWQFTLAILIAVNSAGHVLTKISANKTPSGATGLFYTSLFAMMLALLYAIVVENPQFDSQIIWLAAIGFVNTLGFYCQWRAFEISLSKSIIFIPVAALISTLLSLVFLREAALLNAQLFLGIIFCFSAMWLLQHRPALQEKSETNKNWLVFILLMVAGYGLAIFLLKIFSSTASNGTFMAGWFVGSFFAPVAILIIDKKQRLARIGTNSVILTFLLAMAVVGALLALFQTFKWEDRQVWFCQFRDSL